MKRLIKNLKQDKTSINKIIEQLKNGSSPENWKRFLEIYSQKIYYFPYYVYNKDEEFCSNFYLYVLEHLKDGRRFKTFNPEIASFDTWFNAVLVNFFNEYIRFLKKEESIIVKSLDEFIDDKKTLIKIDNLTDERYKSEIDEEPAVREIRKIINTLEPKLRIALKLQFIFYFNYPDEIDTDEIKIILKESGLPLKEILKRMEEVRNELSKKYRRYKSEEDKLNKYYMKNIILNKKLIEVENKLKQLKELKIIYPADLEQRERLNKFQLNLVNNLQKNQEKIKKILKKRDDGKFIVLAGKEKIAYILNINPVTAGTRLHRAVKKLKEKLKKFIKD